MSHVKSQSLSPDEKATMFDYPSLSVDIQGQKHTRSYKVFAAVLPHRHYSQDLTRISFWHDLPLLREPYHRGIYNFVCEIPRGSLAKMEVSTNEPLNPIRQDTRTDAQGKKVMRTYAAPIEWNYGMFPRTWEDPGHKWPFLGGLGGDGDPLDVIEVGDAACTCGGVYPVKVLGALALIDDGEVDWKVICVRLDSSLGVKLQDIGDLDAIMPGELDRIRTWLRDYKIPEGKPPNVLGLDGRCLTQHETRTLVIDPTAQAYQAGLQTRRGIVRTRRARSGKIERKTRTRKPSPIQNLKI